MPLPPRRPRTKARAFTLIELLTVIAIIGVLAAILIPVVGRVRESARSAACVSNLRQQAVAVMLFASERRNVLPPPQPFAVDWPDLQAANIDNPRWCDLVAPYLQKYKEDSGANDGKVFKCPSDLDRRDVHTSYGFNVMVSKGFSPRYGMPMNEIQNPSRTFLIAETGNAPWGGDIFMGKNDRTDFGLRHAGGANRVASYNSAAEVLAGGGRANVAYADGRVGPVTPQESLLPNDAFYPRPL